MCTCASSSDCRPAEVRGTWVVRLGLGPKAPRPPCPAPACPSSPRRAVTGGRSLTPHPHSTRPTHLTETGCCCPAPRRRRACRRRCRPPRPAAARSGAPRSRRSTCCRRSPARMGEEAGLKLVGARHARRPVCVCVSYRSETRQQGTGLQRRGMGQASHVPQLATSAPITHHDDADAGGAALLNGGLHLHARRVLCGWRAGGWRGGCSVLGGWAVKMLGPDAITERRSEGSRVSMLPPPQAPSSAPACPPGRSAPAPPRQPRARRGGRRARAGRPAPARAAPTRRRTRPPAKREGQRGGRQTVCTCQKHSLPPCSATCRGCITGRVAWWRNTGGKKEARAARSGCSTTLRHLLALGRWAGDACGWAGACGSP